MVVGTFVAEDLPGERFLDHLDCLSGAVSTRLLFSPKAVKFLGPVTKSESEDQPTSREHIDHRRVLGNAQGVVERKQ